MSVEIIDGLPLETGMPRFVKEDGDAGYWCFEVRKSAFLYLVNLERCLAETTPDARANTLKFDIDDCRNCAFMYWMQKFHETHDYRDGKYAELCRIWRK